MVPYCALDLLPIELLHLLFSHFGAHEVIWTFSNVSDYIDLVLQNYSIWNVNFKSIRKSDFDRVCKFIQPVNVISLTLSDDIDTPGQTELFFSYFRIDQFTQLRFLKLINIEIESLELIFKRLHTLKRLTSLSFNHYKVTFKHSRRYYSYSDKIKLMSSLLSESYSVIIPQMTTLHLNDSQSLETIQLINLRHLTLARCSIDDLQIISKNSIQLKSLNIQLNLQASCNFHHFRSMSLIRLRLIIKNYTVCMNTVQQIVLNLPSLKYLDLYLRASIDVLDGKRWQILTTRLKRFRFVFMFQSRLNEMDLKTFQTNYWLEEKRWFIDYWDQQLFSVDQFESPCIAISKSSTHSSHSSQYSICRMNIEKLTIFSFPENAIHRFMHVKTLKIVGPILNEKLSSSVELKHVKHLCVPELVDIVRCVPFHKYFPNVNQLTIDDLPQFCQIRKSCNYQLLQIRRLNIVGTLQNNKDMLKTILFIFPCVEYLKCSFSEFSRQFVLTMIDRLPHLSSVSISGENLHTISESTVVLSSEDIIKENELSNKSYLTYRFQESSSLYPRWTTNWWISK